MNIYYVYQHSCPLTKQVVYVGRGQAHRAWATYNQRGEEHRKWLDALFLQGYTMEDIVKILHKSLTKDTSKALEKTEIEKTKPKFNYHFNKDDRRLSLSPETISKAKEYRSAGLSYSRIATLLNSTPMTIWRSINVKS